MTAVLAVMGLGVASWLLRAMFVLVVPADRLPRTLREGLTHLAPAALAALVAVEVADASRGLDPARTGLLLAAVLLAGITARVTGSSLLAIAVGLLAAVLLDVVLV